MSNTHKGFSLLEAVIVAGLIAIVAAVFLPAFFNSLKNYRVQTSAEMLAEQQPLLAEARFALN